MVITIYCLLGKFMNALQFLEQFSDIGTIDTDHFDFPVLIPSLLEFSDYSCTTCVEESNYITFLEDFGDNEFVHTISGHFGYNAIALHPNALKNPDIKAVLGALKTYPVLSEENLSELEHEYYLEYWQDHGKDDFLDQLNKKFDLEQRYYYCFNFLDNDCDSDTLLEFFESLNHCGDYYWSEQPGSVYINFKASVNNCTVKDLAKFIKANR